MTFKKVFRGYDPRQVDKYVQETAQKEAEIRTAQKERIDQLTDENYALLQKVKQYQMDEKAISKSLIETQKLANELKGDAERFSELVLARAKIFYATWHAYSKLMIATMSAEEVEIFNKLKRKIEFIINAYEGKDVASEIAQIATSGKASAKTTESNGVDVKPTDKTMGVTSNPIKKVEQAAEHAIDLRELVSTDDNLEDICKELGLI